MREPDRLCDSANAMPALRVAKHDFCFVIARVCHSPVEGARSFVTHPACRLNRRSTLPVLGVGDSSYLAGAWERKPYPALTVSEERQKNAAHSHR